MKSSWLLRLALGLVLIASGCGDDDDPGTADTGGGVDASADLSAEAGEEVVEDAVADVSVDEGTDSSSEDAESCDTADATRCDGELLQACQSDVWVTLGDCSEQNTTCVEDGGSASCFAELDDDFVGEAACLGCHTARDADLVAAYLVSGHRFKLNEVEGGTAPEYPYSELPDLAGTDLATLGFPNFTNITYVIGGYGWKARFMGPDGFVITGNEETSGVQYNLDTEEWSSYHTGVETPFTCGNCHTTGWVATGALGPHQDDLPGIYGLFSEPGVRCEGCHGPGADHIAGPSTDNIGTADTERCGECHSRGSDMGVIPGSGGLIRHHEQYQELLASPHAAMDCTTCHDPHASTHYDDEAPGEGVTIECVTCHNEDEYTGQSHETRGADCVTCHMPPVVKSATSEEINGITYGDIPTHLFELNTDVGATLTTTVDEVETVNDSVPVDFACGQCHDEDSAWVQSNFDSIHDD